MATYYVDSNAAGTADGSSWANAYGDIVTALTGKVGGDVLLVSHLHNKNYAALTTYTFPTTGVISVLCVNTGTGALAKTAIENSGAFNFNMQGNAQIYGLDIRCGSASAGIISIGNVAASALNIDSCSFTLSTYSIAGVRINTSSSKSSIKISNSLFVFGHTGQNISYRVYGVTELFNCQCTGTAVNTMLFPSSCYGVFKASSCDFSNATNLIDISNSSNLSYTVLSNCKIPSSVFTGTHPGVGYSTTEIHACSSSDTVVSYRFKDGTGQIDHSTSYYLTSGGSQVKDQNGSIVSYSLQTVPSSNVSSAFPLYSPWVSKAIPATGSKTISMKIAYDSATALKDTEVWIEVEYYGDASSPLSTVEASAPVVSGTKSRDILAAGTDLTDTSEGWTGTFTNKKTATLSKTVTIAQQGYVRCRVAIAKQQTIYVDNVIWVA